MTDVVDRAVADVMRRGGERITGINGTTRDGIMGIVRDTVSQGMDEGVGINEMYRNLETALGNSYLFNDVRSELIARTETALAYNGAALGTYSEFGVERVQAIDGDDDEVCAERNGQDFSIEEAANIEDHPNGTLDWVPFFETGRGVQPEDVAPPAEELPVEQQTPADIINANGTAPVSAAFDTVIAQVESHPLALKDKQFVTVIGKIKSALKTIEETFTDGNLPPMPRIGPIKFGNSSLQGAYKHNSSGARLPVSLEFRANANMETVFHEATHFIDQHGLGFEGSVASRLGFEKARGTFEDIVGEVRTQARVARDLGRLEEATKLDRTVVELQARADVMEPVARAIMESDGYSAIFEVAQTGKMPTGLGGSYVQSGSRVWASYARAPEEAFARAMGQYLAKRHGKSAVRELEQRLYIEGTKTVRPLADQWDWKDFEPIDRAITQMLRDVGWLIE